MSIIIIRKKRDRLMVGFDERFCRLKPGKDNLLGEYLKAGVIKVTAAKDL